MGKAVHDGDLGNGIPGTAYRDHHYGDCRGRHGTRRAGQRYGRDYRGYRRQRRRVAGRDIHGGLPGPARVRRAHGDRGHGTNGHHCHRAAADWYDDSRGCLRGGLLTRQYVTFAVTIRGTIAFAVCVAVTGGRAVSRAGASGAVLPSVLQQADGALGCATGLCASTDDCSCYFTSTDDCSCYFTSTDDFSCYFTSTDDCSCYFTSTDDCSCYFTSADDCSCYFTSTDDCSCYFTSTDDCSCYFTSADDCSCYFTSADDCSCYFTSTDDCSCYFTSTYDCACPYTGADDCSCP
jgi:hypothetical protein